MYSYLTKIDTDTSLHKGSFINADIYRKVHNMLILIESLSTKMRGTVFVFPLINIGIGYGINLVKKMSKHFISE